MVVVTEDDHLLYFSRVMYNQIKCTHRQCLYNFHDKFNKVQKQAKPNFTEKNQSHWIKVLAVNKVLSYISDIEQQEPSKVLNVKELENIYIFNCLSARKKTFRVMCHALQNCSSKETLNWRNKLQGKTLLCTSEGLLTLF